MKKIIKKKLRDLTKNEALYFSFEGIYCNTRCNDCKDCIFNIVECRAYRGEESNLLDQRWWFINKEMFSEKFLDQEIEIEVEVKLTEDEKVILKNIDKSFKFIARCKEGDLCVYESKPIRSNYDGDWVLFNSEYNHVYIYNHLFQFITSEDEEPYLISDLLK